MPALEQKLAANRTSYDWIEYFYQNAREPTLPWLGSCGLSPADCRTVARSVQVFQLGEQGEGQHLIKEAEAWAKKTRDKGYVPALKLFVREEQRHSRILGRFLELNGIPRLERHWTDTVFRRLRNLAGLELCMRVLATAEILAVPYYTALRDSTGSPLLRAICERILEEEAEHLQFQNFTFECLAEKRDVYLRRFVDALHGIFLLAAASIVWSEHRTVFRAAHWTARKLFASAKKEFEGIVLIHSEARALSEAATHSAVRRSA